MVSWSQTVPPKWVNWFDFAGILAGLCAILILARVLSTADIIGSTNSSTVRYQTTTGLGSRSSSSTAQYEIYQNNDPVQLNGFTKYMHICCPQIQTKRFQKNYK